MADQLRDCFFAFKWVSTNIEKYGGDLNNVFVTGDSAGGFLAAYSALLNSSENLEEYSESPKADLSSERVA